MSLSILKYIGFGILGLGGVSSVAVLSSSRVREFIGLSSPLTEEDGQGQFLYKVSKKVFDSLKQDSGSDLSENPKDNVIKGLKDKFNGSLENEEDTWANFKSLCKVQESKETNGAPNVDNEYSRLCFLDNPNSKDDSKGSINRGYFAGAEQNLYISSSYNIRFVDLSKTNFELGTSFKNKYSNASPLDKFDEGYNSDLEEAQIFREAMERVSSGSHLS